MIEVAQPYLRKLKEDKNITAIYLWQSFTSPKRVQPMDIDLAVFVDPDKKKFMENKYYGKVPEPVDLWIYVDNEKGRKEFQKDFTVKKEEKWKKFREKQSRVLLFRRG